MEEDGSIPTGLIYLIYSVAFHAENLLMLDAKLMFFYAYIYIYIIHSGTLPHHLCVGFGAACNIASQEMARDAQWVGYLSKRMLEAVMSRIPEVLSNVFFFFNSTRICIHAVYLFKFSLGTVWTIVE